MLFSIIFLPVTASAIAQEGCFLHPDSTFYCTDITPEKAAQECSFYDNCVLQAAYFKDASCADTEKFSQCKKALCKSSCKEEFAGKCVGGEILNEKETEWCTAGCCQFPYFGGSFCEYKENKWKCEIEAKNKEVAQYLFVFPMNEFTCVQQCSGEQLSIEKFQPENVTQTILPSLPSYPRAAENKLSTNSLFLQWVLFLTFLTGLIYLIHASWRWSKRTRLPLPLESGEEKKSFRAGLGLFKTKSRKFQRLNSAYRNKMKHLEHPDILEASEPKIKKEDVFSRLREAVLRHNPPQKETVFENLEHLVEFTKNKEKKSLEKSEAEKALQKLREMTKKK